MNTQFQKLFDIGRNIGRKVFVLVRRHFQAVIAAFVATCFIGLVLLYMKTSPPSEVLLLTGPAGGGGERLGNLLTRKMQSNDVWQHGGQKVKLVAKVSQGYEDNRERINNDDTGKLIGFAQDGFGNSDNVRILLPLRQTYVHIIVSKELYRAATTESGLNSSRGGTSGEQPRTFADIAPLLRTLRRRGEETEDGSAANGNKFRYSAFLGPELSGTRQTAELILSHYGIPIDDVDSGGSYDWEEMRRRLLRGEVHLAFFTSEPGAKTVQEIADDGKCFLLGLDDVDGIKTMNPQIAKVQLLKHSYGIQSTRDDAFCSTDLDVIATRRVIICSKAMSDSDGYWLAKQLSAAVQEEIPTIQWNRNYVKTAGAEKLSYRLHAGAYPLSVDESPWYTMIPSPFWSPLVFVVLSVVIGSLERVSDVIPGAATAQHVPDADVDPLQQKLEQFLSEIEKVRPPIDKKAYRRLQNRKREFEQTVAARFRGDVESSLKEVFEKALGEIAINLADLNPSLPENQIEVPVSDKNAADG